MEIAPEVALSWSRQDIEQRIGIPGGRYTRVNTWFSALLGGALTAIFYASMLPIRGTPFAEMFLSRGMIPPFIVFFAAWALALLFIKSRKLAFQRKALRQEIVPSEHDFVLSSGTVDEVIERIYSTVDDPKYFLLFNRIVIALANLRNLGRVTDVDDILRSQASHDESSMETSYSLVRGFVWAIPVLGFIGTVIGLSEAIGGFGGVLETAEDVSEIKTSLQATTGGLSTAFQTTLQALVAALFIHMFLTFLKKSEEEFLDACSEYCIRNIVNKLRIMPFEKVLEE